MNKNTIVLNEKIDLHKPYALETFKGDAIYTAKEIIETNKLSVISFNLLDDIYTIACKFFGITITILYYAPANFLKFKKQSNPTLTLEIV